MLPLLLVLFAAQSAFGSPSVLVSQYDIDNIPKPVETSPSVYNSYHVAIAWELLNEAEANVLILPVEHIDKDLANSLDSRAKALSACQTILTIGELAPGRSGDACAYANFIDSIVGSADSPLFVGEWLNRVYSAIDVIESVACDRQTVRYQTGPAEYCKGSGRSYNYEAYWDRFFRTPNLFEVDLVNEIYCSSKRLYKAWNIRSNIIGAAVSSCANSRAVRIFQKSLPEIGHLLRTVGNNGDVVSAAAAARAAIRRAA